MSKKYMIVIEFEVPEGLTDKELAQVADSMSIQYESISDGDVANKKAVLTNVVYTEVG